MRNVLSPARLCLTAALLLTGAASAHAQMRVQEDYFNALTADNIRAFLEKTDAVTTGQMTDLEPKDVNLYLTHHLADQGAYKSVTTYTLPGAPPKSETSTMNKAQFIANVQQGLSMIKNDQTKIDIQDLQIADDKKTATLKSVSTDKGMLAMPDGKGGQQLVPLSGTSICTQALALGKTPNNYIQLVSADCTTDVAVSAAAADTVPSPNGN